MEYTHFRLLMPLIRTTNSNDLKNIGKYTREMLQKKNVVYRKTKQKFVVYMKKRVNDAKIPDMSVATLTDKLTIERTLCRRLVSCQFSYKFVPILVYYNDNIYWK